MTAWLRMNYRNNYRQRLLLPASIRWLCRHRCKMWRALPSARRARSFPTALSLSDFGQAMRFSQESLRSQRSWTNEAPRLLRESEAASRRFKKTRWVCPAHTRGKITVRSCPRWSIWRSSAISALRTIFSRTLDAATLRTSASKNNKAALNLLQSNATIVSIVIICRLLQRLSCLH